MQMDYYFFKFYRVDINQNRPYIRRRVTLGEVTSQHSIAVPPKTSHRAGIQICPHRLGNKT